MKNAGKIIFRVAVVLICALLIFVGSSVFNSSLTQSENSRNEDAYYKAKVLSIDKIEYNELSLQDGKPVFMTVYFSAQISSKGVFENRIISAQQGVNLTYGDQDPSVSAGDIIVVVLPASGGANSDTWFLSTFYRVDKLIILVVVFVVFLLLIGGVKGLTSLLSLAITMGAIFLVYVPGILNGYNIYALTMGLGIYSIIGSLLILDGFNKKTTASILGNISGVFIAGSVGFLVNRWMGITGIINEEYNMILWMKTPLGTQIDLRALFWGAMLIGSMGAIMDVCMSIASALQELSENMQELHFSKLFKSGMNIGKDAIGTMTNTLVLAYIGGSLALVLLILFNTNAIWRIFNFEQIATEIIQSVVGSIGILAAVPLTAFFSAYIFSYKKSKKRVGSDVGETRSKATKAQKYEYEYADHDEYFYDDEEE